MRIAHVVQGISGTSIPIEIAVEMSRCEGVECGIVSVEPVPDRLPDILDESLILDALTPVKNYDDLLDDLNRLNFDCVHTHHNRSASAISFLCSYKYKSLSHFNTQHGHAHYSLVQKIINLPVLYFCRNFAYNSHVTKDSYSRLEKAIMSSYEDAVVHNGINTEVLRSYRAEVERNMGTISTATRLIPRKNIDLVIDALKHVSGVNLKVVGDGPMRPKLEKAVCEGGMEERVEFAGFLTHREDVYREISESSCFVLPSKSEGFCVAVVEAMAMGLPVVVSDIPIFREVVGEQGIFVDPGSSQEIAKAIHWIGEDVSRAKSIGEANRRRALSLFDIKRTAESYVNFYRSRMGRPGFATERR